MRATRSSDATSRSRSCRARSRATPTGSRASSAKRGCSRALNHPNICAIYGLEEADGIRFLVLELVEGETLAERLARVHRRDAGLPLREALAHRAADRRSARGRAREGHRPSRSQAGEHQDHARRRGEGAGLRPGEGRRRDGSTSDSSTHRRRSRRRHARRRHPRHRRLHESRAGARQAGGQAHRHLGLRLRASTRC